jgi:hypothetical protein
MVLSSVSPLRSITQLPANEIVPSWIMEKERLEVFEKALTFVRRVHRKHSFECDEYK